MPLDSHWGRIKPHSITVSVWPQLNGCNSHHFNRSVKACVLQTPDMCNIKRSKGLSCESRIWRTLTVTECTSRVAEVKKIHSVSPWRNWFLAMKYKPKIVEVMIYASVEAICVSVIFIIICLSQYLMMWFISWLVGLVHGLFEKYENLWVWKTTVTSTIVIMLEWQAEVIMIFTNRRNHLPLCLGPVRLCVLRMEKGQALSPEACWWLVDVLGTFPLEKKLECYVK